MSNLEGSSSNSNLTCGNVVGEDPLPRKPGEIGYDPVVHGVSSHLVGPSNEFMPLGPHPAERSDSLNCAAINESSGSSSSPRALGQGHSRTDTRSTTSSESDIPLASIAAAAQSTTSTPQPQAVQSTTSLAPSASSISSIKCLTKKLNPSSKPSERLFGFAPRTLWKFFLLVSFFTGVVVGWGLATSANAQSNGSLFGGGLNVTVFIHVAFSLIALTQLLFIERTVFRLRAERFSYLHPEVEMPFRNHLSRNGPSGLSFSPWHRPPLPTYAAALRGAATATGDVEDQEVARMVALGQGDVPPIYGNTRGSTLLAYGFGAGPLANRPTSTSSSSRRIMALRSSRQDGDDAGSRPVSYGQSQQIEDALRAQKLEETLARLEASR